MVKSVDEEWRILLNFNPEEIINLYESIGWTNYVKLLKV